MTFTPDETTKLKAMLLYLAKKKHQVSDGKCGFLANELDPILDELVREGQLTLRPTINSNQYFLNLK
jgi:hypothetical protein